MDPSAITSTSAIQALLLGQGPNAETNLLTALAGQDLEVLLQALQPGSVQLQLPSGQSITAQGQLPYPEGTQLLVRVLPASNDTGLRLQTLEARPPSTPALLAPLFQGEATSLLGHLTQANPPQELLPLIQLMNLLAEAPGGSQTTAGQTQPSPNSAPPLAETSIATSASTTSTSGAIAMSPASQSVPQAPVSAPPLNAQEFVSPLETLLKSLPGNTLPALAKALGSDPGTPVPQLAQDLERWLREGVLQTTNKPDLRSRDSTQPSTASSNAAEASPVQIVLTRLQTLLDQIPELPSAQSDDLLALVKNMLDRPVAETPSRALPAARPPETASANAPASTRANTPNVEAALSSPKTPVTEKPETWEAWIKGSVKTLGDPGLSPREAPFHIAQSKESTGFFEIPVPWSPQGSLQIWVESDASGSQNAAGEGVQRVMLGLNFTRLGETRLGLAKSASGLQVRVWAEHAELLGPERERMEAELKTLGGSVDLGIQSLPAGSPTLRALAAGPSLHALG